MSIQFFNENMLISKDETIYGTKCLQPTYFQHSLFSSSRTAYYKDVSDFFREPFLQICLLPTSANQIMGPRQFEINNKRLLVMAGKGCITPFPSFMTHPTEQNEIATVMHSQNLRSRERVRWGRGVFKSWGQQSNSFKCQ